MISNEQAFKRFKEQILQDGPRLGLSDTFRFACHPGVECFNQCCHDVNIFLAPYDIVRLKNRLGITSGDFLDRYCMVPFGKDLRYPVVMLRMIDSEDLRCPFLDEAKGCSVYEDRPWSCRMYPLGRATPPKTGPGETEAFHFLVREDFCRGFDQAQEWTVAEWLENQGIGEYDEAGRLFQEIAQDKRLDGPEALTPKEMDMLFMVFYDLDKFRRFVFSTKFLSTFEIADETVTAIGKDDLALMRFGFDWIRFALWREPTLKIRDDVFESKKATLEKEEARA